MSKKGAVKKRRVDKAKREVREERPHMCQGCWNKRPAFLDVSHRISVRYDEWAADKKNMDLYCRTCHRDFEQGRIWKLKNGKEAMEWMRSTCEERFYAKLFQMTDRVKEDKPKEIPEWASRLLILVS